MNLGLSLNRHAGRVVRACLVLTASLLCSCATYVQPPRVNTPEIPLWQGRLLVRVDSTPTQSFSANFVLSGDSNRGAMELASPLGTTLAKMQWSEQSARLESAGAARDYGNLEELTFATLGAALPLHAVFDWLNGRATIVSGWQTDLSEWEAGRILAHRTTPTPKVDLKIALER